MQAGQRVCVEKPAKRMVLRMHVLPEDLTDDPN